MAMDKKLIYIADDEINICNIIKSFLIQESFEVITFSNGKALLEAFDKKQPQLIIMDIMMPEIDGFSLCSIIRAKSAVPIIIISARDTEPDKIAGLTLGADDYLTKPFSMMELTARIKSIFRRINLDNSNLDINTQVLDITMDPNLRQACLKDVSLELTNMEFNLLYYLGSNKNRAVSRKELLDKLWGFEEDVETRAADDMIKRIRKKLADAGSSLSIETIRGYGFTIKDR